MINDCLQRDARLAAVIAATTLPPLPEPSTPYFSLLRAVVSQQVARSTAQRIWQRLLNQSRIRTRGAALLRQGYCSTKRFIPNQPLEFFLQPVTIFNLPGMVQDSLRGDASFHLY